MPRLLSEAQIARYREEGYLAPIRIMDEEAALVLRAELEAVEARMGGPLRGDLRHKSHLLFPFLADLVRDPLLLDAAISSSRRRPTRPLSHGTRIRPIGASRRPRW